MIAIYKDPKKTLLQNKQVNKFLSNQLNEQQQQQQQQKQDEQKDDDDIDDKENTYKYEFINFPFISYPIIYQNSSHMDFDEKNIKNLEDHIPLAFKGQVDDKGAHEYIKQLLKLDEISLLKEIYEKTYKINDLDTSSKIQKMISYKSKAEGISKLAFNETIKESAYLYLNSSYSSQEEEIDNTNEKTWRFESVNDDSNSKKNTLIVSFKSENKYKTEYYKCCFFLKNYNFIVKNNLIQSFTFIPNTDLKTVNKLLKILDSK